MFLKQRSVAVLYMTNSSTTFIPAALTKDVIVSLVSIFYRLLLDSFFSAKTFSGSALKERACFIHIPDIGRFIILC